MSRAGRAGFKTVYVHLSKRKRLGAFITAAAAYNNNPSPHPKIKWMRDPPEDSIIVGDKTVGLKSHTAYNHILADGEDEDYHFFEWPTSSLITSSLNAPRASPAAALHETPRTDNRTTPSIAPGKELPVDAPKVAQGKAGVLPSVEEEEEEMSDVEEVQSQVGEKRKIEELLQYAPALDRMRVNEEYCVNNLDQILSISRQKRDDECAIAAAAATATREKIKEHEAAQALSLEKTKEHRAAQAAQEKLSEMRIKEEERLSEIKIKEEEKLASIRIADKDKEMLLNNQKIRILELQHPQSAPVAPIFNAAAVERKEALVDIYKEGRFPRLRSSQFGGMARYVRWRYENQYNKVVFKAGGHDMYPKLTTAAVKQWIKAWLEEPNQL